MTEPLRDPERYMATVLERALADVRGQGEGGRNNALYAATCRVFEVARGLRKKRFTVPDDLTLRGELLAAAQACGLGNTEAAATVDGAAKRVSPAELHVEPHPPGKRQRACRGVQRRRWAPVEERSPAPATAHPGVPTGEVRELWSRSRSVGGHPSAGAWFWRVEEDATETIRRVELLDLCRGLPSTDLPRWAQRWARGWHAVSPAWSPTGELAALHAWWAGEVGSHPPLCLEGRPCVLADPTARAALVGERHPVADGRVLFCDAADFLRFATSDARWSADGILSVVGVPPKGWDPAFVQPLDGARAFILAVRSDRLAATLAADLHGRSLHRVALQ